jgi:hypothetical protein
MCIVARLAGRNIADTLSPWDPNAVIVILKRRSNYMRNIMGGHRSRVKLDLARVLGVHSHLLRLAEHIGSFQLLQMCEIASRNRKARKGYVSKAPF